MWSFAQVGHEDNLGEQVYSELCAHHDGGCSVPFRITLPLFLAVETGKNVKAKDCFLFLRGKTQYDSKMCVAR